MLFNILKLL